MANSRYDALRFLPLSTSVSNTSKGDECYIYYKTVEGIQFKFAITDEGFRNKLYVLDPKTEGYPGHCFHVFKNGCVCAPYTSLETAYAASVIWAAAWCRYVNSGCIDTSGFNELG